VIRILPESVNMSFVVESLHIAGSATISSFSKVLKNIPRNLCYFSAQMDYLSGVELMIFVLLKSLKSIQNENYT